MAKLSVGSIKGAAEPGRYGDGDGLFLVVGKTGSKSWVCRVQKSGHRRDFGLGSAKKTTLAQARRQAAEIRSQVEAGLDPIFERRRAVGIPTFRQAAARVFADTKRTWRNDKHKWQWSRSLELFAYPVLGDLKVSEITGPIIRNVLAEIWLSKPETARRVRQRIGMVLDWAYASGYRDTEAPMRSVTKGLPRQPKKTCHHAAMPFVDVPAYLGRLRARESYSRLALEFTVLTAARSGEVRGATWDEIDFANAVWTILANRMKAEREHVVPLSRRAMAILARCAELQPWHRSDDPIFPGLKRGSTMSDMTLVKVLRDMSEPYTVHGFRSSFRDWVSETTEFSGDLAEAALAHKVRDKTEAAYRRGNLLAKRKALMSAWEAFCDAAGET